MLIYRKLLLLSPKRSKCKYASLRQAYIMKILRAHLTHISARRQCSQQTMDKNTLNKWIRIDKWCSTRFLWSFLPAGLSEISQRVISDILFLEEHSPFACNRFTLGKLEIATWSSLARRSKFIDVILNLYIVRNVRCKLLLWRNLTACKSLISFFWFYISLKTFS